MPPELLVPFSTTSTPHTDFILLCKFSLPPKVSKYKVEIFSFTLYPPGATNKVFELLLYTDTQTDVQMQMIAFTHTLPILNTPYPKNSAIMTRMDEKLRTSIWYLQV